MSTKFSTDDEGGYFECDGEPQAFITFLNKRNITVHPPQELYEINEKKVYELRLQGDSELSKQGAEILIRQFEEGPKTNYTS